MKDWRGTPIKRGAMIIYASHMGTDAWVTEAKVVEVHLEHLVVEPIRSTRDSEPTKRSVKLRAIGRVTVLTPARRRA